jgi:hypothetical protein
VDTQKAILLYQHAERIKAELIIASRLLEDLGTLEGQGRSGAEKLMTTYMEALLGELRIAQSLQKSVNFLGAEKKIMEAIGRMKLYGYTAVQGCLSEALSLVTTYCQGIAKVLMDKRLI